MLNGQGKTKSFSRRSTLCRGVRSNERNFPPVAADIAENGLINPPVVSPDFVLIAGERRLRACKHLGWQQIEVRIISVKDYEHQLKLEISENQKRKNFTFSEGLEWARRLEQVEKLKARERSEANLKQNPECENFPTREERGRATDIVAAEIGFGSGKTYEKAKFVAAHADAETIAKLDAEETACVRFCGLGYQNGKTRFDAERNFPLSAGPKSRLSEVIRYQRTGYPSTLRRTLRSYQIKHGSRPHLTRHRHRQQSRPGTIYRATENRGINGDSTTLPKAAMVAETGQRCWAIAGC